MEAPRRTEPPSDTTGRRQRRVPRRTTQSAVVVGTSLGVLAIGGLGLWYGTRPPSVDEVAARFVSSWNSDAPAVVLASLFRRGSESGAGRGLVEALTRRGWETQRPRVSELSRHEEDTVLGLRFALEEGAAAGDAAREVHVSFEPTGDVYFMTGITLPDYQAAPIAVAQARFEAAWAAQGSTALTSFLAEGLDEEALTRAQRALARRSWQEKRPALADALTSLELDARALITWTVEGAELSARFSWWHTGWRIDALRVPSDD